jgi:hypothetical protein
MRKQIYARSDTPTIRDAQTSDRHWRKSVQVFFGVGTLLVRDVRQNDCARCRGFRALKNVSAERPLLRSDARRYRCCTRIIDNFFFLWFSINDEIISKFKSNSNVLYFFLLVFVRFVYQKRTQKFICTVLRNVYDTYSCTFYAQLHHRCTIRITIMPRIVSFTTRFGCVLSKSHRRRLITLLLLMFPWP